MIDLHMHSLYSDGTFSVPELVKRSKEKGIKILSLTDHDTVEGLSKALDWPIRFTKATD